MRQQTLAEEGFEHYRKSTRREPAPDETTIGKFRHLRETRHLGDQRFALIARYLVRSTRAPGEKYISIQGLLEPGQI